MKYRMLGNTGLRVSELSFGTIPILAGHVPVLPRYYSPDDDTAVQLMMQAYQLGCNLYDTAIVPEYGDAEVKLGLFAKAVGRENIIISDKARFFRGYEMYEAVNASCENLAAFLDIYFVHQVDEQNEDMVFGKYGALDALTLLKQDGVIRFTGIASHYYSVLRRAALDDRVDVLQGSGNIFERGMLDRMSEDEAFGHKGFLLNKVYAAGILPSFFSIPQLLGGVLAYPISSALLGLGTSSQINCAMGEQLEEAQVTFAKVMSRLEKEFQAIPCDRCQRCYCAYDTDIATIFRQYNYFHMGKDYWALRKLNMGIEESRCMCQSCMEMPCIQLCPKGIHIPQKVDMIFELVQAHYYYDNKNR